MTAYRTTSIIRGLLFEQKVNVREAQFKIQRPLRGIHVFSRESPAIEIRVSFSGEHVTFARNRLVYLRGKPESVSFIIGAEFAGQIVDLWAYTH